MYRVFQLVLLQLNNTGSARISSDGKRPTEKRRLAIDRKCHETIGASVWGSTDDDNNTENPCEANTSHPLGRWHHPTVSDIFKPTTHEPPFRWGLCLLFTGEKTYRCVTNSAYTLVPFPQRTVGDQRRKSKSVSLPEIHLCVAM